MKIGLIGVAGSGKTALAEVLGRALELRTPKTIVGVIDYYPEDVADDTGLAIGFLAGYLTNWHVALERENHERLAQDWATHTITCGTLIETTTYAAIDTAGQANQISDEFEKSEEIARLVATMKMFGVLYQDTFNYDHVFYLPAINAEDSEQIRLLDMNIQVAFKAFEVANVHPLMTEGMDALALTEKRCEEALQIIFKEDSEGNEQGD